jgi:phosphatidylserine decarboxylase
MIAREGRFLVGVGLIVAAASIVLATLWSHWISLTVAIVITALALLVTYFFRDPERVAPDEPNVVVSPADGWVVTVDHLDRHDFVGSQPHRVSIFLSVFDVHVNRVPVAGTVEYVEYRKGRFRAAYRDDAGEVNEQTEIGLTTPSGLKAAFKQIAGQVARRIVCTLEKGQTVATGQRCGIIKFGSRADIILPADAVIRVQKGEHVAGGRTILGYLPEPTGADESKTEARDERA